ncbi:MAG: hypothetical protein VW397_02660 [Candidatus Margulisiibacteriota bacterium]
MIKNINPYNYQRPVHQIEHSDLIRFGIDQTRESSANIAGKVDGDKIHQNQLNQFNPKKKKKKKISSNDTIILHTKKNDSLTIIIFANINTGKVLFQNKFIGRIDCFNEETFKDCPSQKLSSVGYWRMGHYYPPSSKVKQQI